MQSLFENVSFPNEPATDADDPFGSVLPAGYVLSDRDCEGDATDAEIIRGARFLTAGFKGQDPERSELQKLKRYDYRKHYPRCEKALDAIHPGVLVWPSDVTRVMNSGQVVAKDCMGFADMMAIAPGRIPIAIQITTMGQVGAHLRKYTDPNNTLGQAKDAPTVESKIRHFLRCGGRFYIFGFYLPRGKRLWEHELVVVTPALLDTYVARKRRRK